MAASFGAVISKVPDARCSFCAEALWDHVTLDPVELGFRAGDVIDIKGMLDRNWWWGRLGDREGWFPSAFVVLKRTGCDITKSHESVGSMSLTAVTSGQSSGQCVTQHRVRAKVVCDMLTSEQVYVKLLRDIVEGFLLRIRRCCGLFTEDSVATIFCNIEQIYDLSRQLLADMEATCHQSDPYNTRLASCFLKRQKSFEIYSEYSNSHPYAFRLLQSLKQTNVIYQRFFEVCRLQRGMARIPLEGFLLSPIQKMCRYPVQLKELLDHTPADHPDHGQLERAVDAMTRIVRFINERKRKMESIEMLMMWQNSINDWQGPCLAEHSSEMIHSGELIKISGGGWKQHRVVFLFDHQLLYCKRDLLLKDLLSYRGRIFTDVCLLLENQASHSGQRYGFKLFDSNSGRWIVFACRDDSDYRRWLDAFATERQVVTRDQLSGFDVQSLTKQINQLRQMTKGTSDRRWKIKQPRERSRVRSGSISPYSSSSVKTSAAVPSRCRTAFPNSQLSSFKNPTLFTRIHRHQLT